MRKPKVVITQRWPASVEAVLAEHFDVTLNLDDHTFSDAEMRHALGEADAICPTVTNNLSSEIFADLSPTTRIIGNFGVGYSHIDIECATSNNITVTNTPDVLSECTADIAMTLLLMCARRAAEGERELRAGNWKGWRPTHMMGHKVSGKTLGIIGFGRIGQETAKRAHFGFGMKVLAIKRSPIDPDILNETGAIQASSIDEILEQSDFVSLHCPGGEANRHLINRDTLAKMKNSAILINTARGEVVDEIALASALNQGLIGGAGLDVFEGEPNINPALLACKNAVLLPHLGSATLETREAMGFRVVENLQAFFAGKTPPDAVN